MQHKKINQKKDGFISQIAAVWNYFSTFTLPGNFFKTKYTDEELPPLMRPLTPLIGGLLSVPALVIIILAGFAGRTPAFIAGACLAPLVLELLTGWQGLTALSRYMDARSSGAPQSEALPGEFADDEKGNCLFVKISIYLFRSAMLGALCWSSAAWWIVVALVGGYLVRAEVATCRTRDGVEFFPADVHVKNYHWIVAAILMLLVCIFFTWNILPILTAYAVSWLIGTYGSHLCADAAEGASRNALNIFGYMSELLLLLLGVLIYTH